MKKIIAVVFLSMLLQGCIAAAAIVASSTATAIISTDPRSVAVIRDDESITQQINHKIHNDPEMSSVARISAVSYNRVVLLTGEAYTPALRNKAEEYAQQVEQPKVKRIFNKITIGPPKSSLDYSQDVFITTSIRTKMLATQDLKSNNFKIVTSDGTVFILGTGTTRQQTDMVVDIARKTKDVKQVVKLVEYESR